MIKIKTKKGQIKNISPIDLEAALKGEAKVVDSKIDTRKLIAEVNANKKKYLVKK